MGLATIIRKEKIKQNEFRILILGLDNAGKSTVLDRWLFPLGSPTSTQISPTFGFEIKTLQHFEPPCRLNFWDIGGQKSIRPFWRNYYEETEAVVWVVDSAAPERLEDCKRELEAVLNEDRLLGASLLILANKQDSPGAVTLTRIHQELGLDRLKDLHHHWRIIATSAKSGLNLSESLQWLAEELISRRTGR